MTSSEFRAALAALGLSQQAFGRACRVAPRTVQRWALGERDIPGTVEAILGMLAARAVTPPPATLRPEDDRDEPCAQAIEPHLDALLVAAEGSGWTPPEVVSAALGWVISTTVAHAGTQAARELLDDADEIVDLSDRANNLRRGRNSH